MASTLEDRAEKLKKKANDAYAAQNYQEAYALYRKAFAVNPHEPVYLSNISACLYETGTYHGCVTEVAHAWQLISSMPGFQTDPKALSLIRKLSLRCAKALLQCISRRIDYSLDESSSQDMLELRHSADASETQDNGVTEMRRLWAQWDENAVKDMPVAQRQQRRKEIGSLWASMPRYKAYARAGGIEYYTVGHEGVSSALSSYIPKEFRESHGSSGGRIHLDKLSLSELSSLRIFCGGVGDARHVFGTFLDLTFQLRNLSSEKKQALAVHMNLVDWVPAVLARDLIILSALEQYAKLDPMRYALEREEIIVMVSYVYLGVLIPPYSYDRLLSLIPTIIDRITDQSRHPKWLRLSSDAIPKIVSALKYWQTFREKSPQFSNEYVHSCIRVQTRSQSLGRPEPTNDQEYNEKMRLDTEGLVSAGLVFEYLHYTAQPLKILYPPKTFRSRHPKLKAIFSEYEENTALLESRRSAPEHKSLDASVWMRAQKHVLESWRVNPTLFEQNLTRHFGEWPDASHNPCIQIQAYFSDDEMPNGEPNELMYLPTDPGNLQCTVEYCSYFFKKVAESFHNMKNYIVLEFTIGELYETLEKEQCESSPPQYNRIFHSTIPDHMGSLLPLFTHTVGSLKPGGAAHAEFVFNRSAWQNLNHFVYNAMFLATSQLERFLGMQVAPGASVDEINCTFLPYPRPLDKLASRSGLANWLNQILLKLALPAPSANIDTRIPQPLMLNAFVKLLGTLQHVGYPSHWLSAILESILSDKVVLNGRLPWDQRLPISVPDVRPAEKVHLNLAPYRAELEVTVAMALPILPFSLSLPSDCDSPPRSRIFKYSTSVGAVSKFPDASLWRYKDLMALCQLAPCIALAFAPSKSAIQSIGKLYDWVCGGNEKGKPAKDIVLVQAVAYDPTTFVAEWWMDRNRVEAMRANKWVMGIVRLDVWGPAGSILPFNATEIGAESSLAAAGGDLD